MIMNLEDLKIPFPVKAIRWRIGATNKRSNGGKATKGIALAYIDARDLMKRFDDVCGLDWQCRYSHVTSKGVVCEIGVKIDGEWLWRANGAGETDVEGEKGALSDAFKRAGVMWGPARYLYYLDNIWVDMDERGKFLPPKLPDWATPEGFTKSQHSRKMMKEAVEKTREHLVNGDSSGVREIHDELEPEEQLIWFAKFNSQERTAIKEYLK